LTELCEIAYRYGTDKCPQIKHHFTELYAGLFAREEVRKVVEIGIGQEDGMFPGYKPGASLRMWAEWYPRARVWGIDVDPRLMFIEERITTLVGDQREELDLLQVVDAVGPDVDLWIDDGLHTVDSQVWTCRTVLPLLWDDAIYVIEDCASEIVNKKLSEDFAVEVWTPRRRRYRDDRLVIVRKRE
jgi:hypothetical protein